MTASLHTPIKRLALAALLGGLLYVAYGLLGPSPTPPASAPAQDDPAEPGRSIPQTAPMRPAPGSLDAAEFAQAYAKAPQEADARFKGRRIPLHGVVEQTEAGQGQILLITLGGTEGHAGLRTVADMATQQNKTLAKPQTGQSVNMVCLNQGLLMGEPVLSDCQLLP
jgi:hypothetical protein